jgi:hypothetical protein
VTIVPKEIDPESTALLVFTGKTYLGDYVPEGNFYALIAGPAHITDKYGEDNQSGEYKMYLGNLSGMTDNLETTKLFDFTGYPLRAGNTDDDDVMNAMDYSAIITDLLKEDCVRTDMDGNGLVNNADLKIFTNNIKIRNGKMY